MIACRVVLIILSFFVYPIGLNAQSNPVIIELFTSQGCSSCPAADKNLAAIVAEAKKENLPIFGLSFHVDYWNYIGWKDPYSNKLFTERQRKYAAHLNLASIYTPQIIVNGNTDVVGSNQNGMTAAIDKASKLKARFILNLNKLEQVEGYLHILCTTDKLPDNETINIALVEDEIENDVPRGENGGRRLRHANVVRSFTTLPLQQDQNLKIKLPEMNLKKATLIIYIQDATWSVVGAVAKRINN